MEENKSGTQSGPYTRELDAGMYQWCTCGLSSRGAMCDGSHRAGLGELPKPFMVSERKRVVLCGCRRTNNPPYCDGTHMTQPADSE